MLTETLPPPLFDEDVFTGSGPRAGKDDPIQSHMAADRSQKTLRIVKVRVLHLLAYRSRSLNGNDLNELYRDTAKANGWERVHFDSPRKRAGELARDGYLTATRTDANGNDLDEALYSITDKGLEALR